jgi:hypothetical protein
MSFQFGNGAGASPIFNFNAATAAATAMPTFPVDHAQQVEDLEVENAILENKLAAVQSNLEEALGQVQSLGAERECQTS